MAALAHLGCIMGGAAWYRFFGAGERMARQAKRGDIMPTIITFAIAAMLATWSLYAFSGARLIPPLPGLRPGLVAITAIYLLRAAAFPLMLRIMPDRSVRFLVWSSLIVFVIGAVHFVGLYVE
ncbi:MAG: hypothetical protein V4595_00910 [Pseudomonadota bacterium]